MDWFPHDVPGWLSEPEGYALARFAVDKSVLEIGSYCGRSTICLAQSARIVFCVDTFDGRATPNPTSTFLEFERNIFDRGLSPKVVVCPGESAKVVPTIPQKFDLIFIDGDHNDEAVKSDIMVSWPLLVPNGLFAFHDYSLYPGEFQGWNPGVTWAVNKLIEAGGKMIERYETLAVVQPPTLPRDN
jgi:hypothetical protein